MSWNQAKMILDETSFPEETDGWKDADGKEFHSKGKSGHQMTTSSKYVDPIKGFEVEAKYNYCKECGEVKNKALRMYNNEEGLVYEKWFKYHGKTVGRNEDVLQIAKQVFAVFALVLVL